MRVPYDPSERVPAKDERAVVREFLEGASGADLTVLDRLVGDEALKQTDTTLRSAFPDISFDLEDLASEDGRVIARFVMTGTHEGLFRGVDATGKRVSARGSAAFRVEEGKIMESRIDLDEEAILQQIGGPDEDEQHRSAA